jgi:hypothetical protein
MHRSVAYSRGVLLPALLILASTLFACGDDSDDSQGVAGADAGDDTSTSADADVRPEEVDVEEPEPTCGDGNVDDFEACDDGNRETESACPYGTSFCNGCSADCSESLFLEGNTCGDGELDTENEQCDRDSFGDATCASLVPESLDGNLRCSFDCQTVELGGCRLPICGDGVQEGSEVCDEGDTSTETACAYGEASCARCNGDCSATLDLTGPVCGDGTRSDDEMCDDGNAITDTECAYGTTACEACSADCKDVISLTGPVCGDRVRNGDEVCDGGGGAAPDACPWGQATCAFCAPDCGAEVVRTGPYCGDGAVQSPQEVCDPLAASTVTCESLSDEFSGGTSACADDCSAWDTRLCEGRPCGNGTLDEGEICDDGNARTETECPWGERNCVTCDSSCSAELTLEGPYCGDGELHPREVCDAGEETPAESCEYGVAECEICRPGCDGVDVIEGPYCGDGTIDSVETCDDGELNGALGQCSSWSCAGTVAQLPAPAEYVGDDEWGYYVALNERWLVVGQPFEEIDGRDTNGAMYVFERVGAGFVFSQRIANVTSESFSGFAMNLHVVGDEILTTCQACADGNGALLSFRYDGTTWSLSQSVTPTGTRRAGFGSITALSDDVAVLIAPFFAIDGVIGVPWVFERNASGNWEARQRLIPTPTDVYLNCGAAVRADTIVIGDCERNGFRGALVVFERVSGTWTQQVILTPNAPPGGYPATLSNFGRTLTFVGDDIIVAGIDALIREDGTGWMVAFERDGAGWTEIDSPRVDEVGTPTGVGSTLLGTDTRLAVGYVRAIDGVILPETTFIERRAGAWIVLGRVRHPVSNLFSRSESFAAWGDRFVVGSPFNGSLGRNAGIIWIY